MNVTHPVPRGTQSRLTGMADAILAEITFSLGRLAGDPDICEVIDLKNLPMTEADRNDLRQRLGQGEVAATLDVSGPSEIAETGFSGVWWIAHAGGEDKVIAEQIVVARVPPILLAHPADIAAAAKRLASLASAPKQSALPSSKENHHA